jgi:exodeoxyribonuclease-5
MRGAAGFAGDVPTGENEKIICLKNDNALGLINGMFLQLSDIERVNAYTLLASVTTEEGEACVDPSARKKDKRLSIYTGHFEDHVRLEPDRHDRDWKIKKKLVEATYGWAITCHKAQGSQWENVVVWEDGLGRTQEDRNRWLYTAITRAERGLLILE